MIRQTVAVLALLVPPLPAPADGTLPGSQWHFVAAGGSAIPAAVTADIAFGTDGTASGSSAATASAAATRKARRGSTSATSCRPRCCCMDTMAVEQAVFAALEATAGYATDDGRLELLDNAGAVVAVLEASR